MLHVSYEIWGLAMVAFLVALWTVKGVVRRIRKVREIDSGRSGISASRSDRSDVEHRALMFLMTQKTDSVLAALARTIDEERQKLGAVVRNPSIGDAHETYRVDAAQAENQLRSAIDRIPPMFREGLSEAAIARKLHLPETEVAMVMRLHAA